MDKNTLGHYGWVVISVIIIAIMIGLASPFAGAIKGNFVDTVNDFGGRMDAALEGIGNGEEDKETVQTFTFMQEVIDGDYQYVYMGYESDEDIQKGYNEYCEKEYNMSFDEFLILTGATKENVLNSAKLISTGNPQWTVRLNSNEITGTFLFPSEYLGIPVTSIGSNTTDTRYENVTDVIIPDSILTISDRSLSFFVNATSVTFERISPADCNPSELDDFDIIYVPAESVEAYKNAEGWSDYANIIQAIPES